MMKRTEVVFGVPRRWTWLVLPAVLLSLGCGTPSGNISGKVSYQGKPLTAGTINFFGAGEQVVGTSSISPEGTYSMPKVPTGPVKITVTAPPDSVRDLKDPPPTKRKLTFKEADKELEKNRFHTPVEIPAKYKMPSQSDLTYTVQPGSQEYSIDLK